MSGHRPREYHGQIRCRDCSRRLLSFSEVPPAVTLAQLLLAAGALGAVSVWFGWW